MSEGEISVEALKRLALEMLRDGDDYVLDYGAKLTRLLPPAPGDLDDELRRELAAAGLEDDAPALYEHTGMGICIKGRRHAPPCYFGNGV